MPPILPSSIIHLPSSITRGHPILANRASLEILYPAIHFIDDWYPNAPMISSYRLRRYIIFSIFPNSAATFSKNLIKSPSPPSSEPTFAHIIHITSSIKHPPSPLSSRAQSRDLSPIFLPHFQLIRAGLTESRIELTDKRVTVSMVIREQLHHYCSSLSVFPILVYNGKI